MIQHVTDFEDICMNVRSSTAQWLLLSPVPDTHIPNAAGGEPCQLHLLCGVPEEEGGCDAALAARGVKVPQLGSVRQEQSHTESVDPRGLGHGPS